MAFTSFISHLLCGWFAFLLPSYKMYKALKHRPVSEPELERWAGYWAVIGAIVAFEYAAEWAISWFPFYWELKTLFLLFLSLPQTQGSSYIYQTYLEPYFQAHEADIDQGIESAQTELLTFLQKYGQRFFELAWSVVSKTPIKPADAQGNGQANAGTGPNPAAALQGLWSAYGPTVLGALGKRAQPAERPDVGARTNSAASARSTGAAYPASVPLPPTPGENAGYM
ncbi:hypothetical protein PENSPDRAFT_645316 [Peniophora sp. CONT]|nr:hypothetical protein PENSPDRAFT_645316 [Peniophora sp. CONT]